MKPNLRSLTICFVLIILGSSKVTAQTKSDLIGKWSSVAPDAPEEYQKSIARITQDSVFVSFDGVYFMPSNSMEFKNDTLKYEINGVFCTFIFESKTKMKGMSNWASGQSEVTMIKIEDTESDTKNTKR